VKPHVPSQIPSVLPVTGSDSEEALDDDDLIEDDVELDLPSPSVTPGESAKVVLVADDDPDIRAMLVRALGMTYTVYEARDGEEALQILQVIPLPDAFVCDVMMPKLDGIALVKALRKEPSLSRMPVLFLTAKGGPLDVVTGINAGARHYVTKPFKIADVLAKVAGMTGQAPSKPAAAASKPVSATNRPATATSKPGPATTKR
jgi:DNA-binding response OmpR family regulator